MRSNQNSISPEYAAHMDSIEQAISIKYNNIVYEMKQRGVDVIVLSLGEAFFDIPLHGFDDLPFPDIFHYSHSRGVQALREKLCGYYKKSYDVHVDPEEEIIVTAGSKVAIHMAFMAILNPTDEVIIPEPAWVSYTEQVKLCHGVPVSVPCGMSTRDIGGYVTEKTKAIVINSPHNPRGKVYSRDELDYLHDVAEQNGLYLISDEAYSDFLVDEEYVSCGVGDKDKKHTIVCNSMSKNYGMSGWRIGYVITNPSLTSQILKINQHLITCPATILSHYLVKHFDDILEVTRPQMKAVVEKRAKLAAYMDSLEMSYLPGTGTFYFFVSIEGSRLTSDEFCTRLLEEYRVSSVPGIGYGSSCDHYIRISVGTESMERTEFGIRKLKKLIDETTA